MTSQTTEVKWRWKKTERFFFLSLNHMKRLPSLERSAAPINKSLLASRGKRARGENVTVLHVGPGKARVTEPVPG